jgi:endonuclease/exonuclease/phosphatase family metal-dependent hydrolase
MKKLLRITGVFITITLAIIYLVSCLTSYISPVHFPAGTLFSLAYLPVFLVYFLLVIIWFFVRRKIALLLLIPLFAGYKNIVSTIGLHVFRAAWHAQKDSGTIRVMCWNINYVGDPYISHNDPGSRRAKALGYIREVQPDILCLQDFSLIEERGTRNVFFNNMNDVLETGKFPYCYFPFFYEHDGRNYAVKTGVAVFSKLPLTDTGSFNTGGQISDEKTGYVDVLLNNKPLRIYTTHLSSMNLWPNANGEAGLDYLEGDSTKQRTSTVLSKLNYFGKVHARQAEAIKKELDQSPCPLLFSGDLNSVPSGYVYHTLAKGLEDAFLEKDFGIGGTYHLVFPRLRIDVLLHSKEIEVVQFTRPAVGLSDHYPLIADIRWKNK